MLTIKDAYTPLQNGIHVSDVLEITERSLYDEREWAVYAAIWLNNYQTRRGG
jgi:hypothetical protein